MLADMSGAGELGFEFGFLPGADLMGEVMYVNGPAAGVGDGVWGQSLGGSGFWVVGHWATASLRS